MYRRGRDGMAAGGAVGSRQQQDDQDEEEVEVLEQEEYPDNAHLDNLEEFDEEDVYIMVELPAGVDAAMLESSTVTAKGIGTQSPQLKIGDVTFEGKTEPIVGTAMAFKAPPPGDSGQTPLELECYSNMRMTFVEQTDSRGRKRPKR